MDHFTAPAPQAQPNRNILSKEPFTLDMPAVHAWFAEQRAAWEKRLAEDPMTPSYAPTLAQLEERDFRSLVAGGWVLL